ncbi:hypothetical protein BDF19DRAFT_411767 [Syncephalis fuscata]|nr:hypothetical protein BDF19DRAFT_411767 [Syncephalis fuscata]
MSTVFIGAGVKNCGLSEFEFACLIDTSKQENDVCSKLISQMEQSTGKLQCPTNLVSAAPAPASTTIDSLTGRLCDMALEQDANSIASTRPQKVSLANEQQPLWRIAPCRRPRNRASGSEIASTPSSLTTVPHGTISQSALLSRSSAMALSLQDTRRQRAISAPAPLSPSKQCEFVDQNGTILATNDGDNSSRPSLQRKRRLSLDVEVPPSVLKRRGAISPLAVPSLELIIQQTRARMNAGTSSASSFVSSSLIGLPALASSNTSYASSDDDDDEADDSTTPWAL